MKARLNPATIGAILLVASLPFSAAHAQLSGLLKQGEGGGLSGALGNLGGGSNGTSGAGGIAGALSGGSMLSGSSSNVAGLLEFCIKNNYLSGNSVASVKNSLMSKLPGGSASASSDSGYTNGAKGILSGSNGSQLDLSGGGLKEKITKQVCDKVLAQGKSML
ncbi:MAG: DUF2501 domain-containing protein [Burkholderiaceae bacterium]|jgi:hypothetical protein|nr:MAG: DUF2501 domain-containing protein [Burkholderiaceae bacterium]TBR72893.1 MAG: DUF2501 domain-containing protein [Burkholderiaceae bacterium]